MSGGTEHIVVFFFEELFMKKFDSAFCLFIDKIPTKLLLLPLYSAV